MPQDVPLEASAKLAFTPDCLKSLDAPPVFTLRTGTWREKERRLDLHALVGAINHTDDAVRQEVRNGLRAGWTEEQFEEFIPVLEDFWQQTEEFRLQVKDDPDLAWDFDPAVQQRIEELTGTLERTWPPLAQMATDMRKHHRFEAIIYFAVMVENWTDLDLKRELDAGYLSIDCAYNLRTRLFALDEKAGVAVGTSAAELQLACLRRLYLDEGLAKNSASPSPSTTTQQASKVKTLAKAGKSPASASSRSTRRKA